MKSLIYICALYLNHSFHCFVLMNINNYIMLGNIDLSYHYCDMSLDIVLDAGYGIW